MAAKTPLPTIPELFMRARVYGKGNGPQYEVTGHKLVPGENDDNFKVYVIETIEGVGAMSYILHEFTVRNRKPILGFKRKPSITERFVDVYFSNYSAVYNMEQYGVVDQEAINAAARIPHRSRPRF